MEIVPLGDSAVIVRVREQFEDAPEETLDGVVRTFRHLRNAAIPGVIELAPAYTSVAVFFDPVAVTKESAKGGDAFDWLAERIRAVVAAGADRGRRVRTTRSDVRLAEIPVCYDPEFDPTKNPPALLQAGDRVRFRVITRQEFEALKR